MRKNSAWRQVGGMANCNVSALPLSSERRYTPRARSPDIDGKQPANREVAAAPVRRAGVCCRRAGIPLSAAVRAALRLALLHLVDRGRPAVAGLVSPGAAVEPLRLRRRGAARQ